MCEEQANTHPPDLISAGPTPTTSAESAARDQPSTACEIDRTASQDDDGSEHATPTLSKKAQKKLRKAERLAALKTERRAREKAAKKEKRKEMSDDAASGGTQMQILVVVMARSEEGGVNVSTYI